MAEIVLSHVKKVYPNESEKKGFFGKKKSKEKKHNLQVTDEGVLAVQDFNLTVHDHEFVVFVGPSGCGKSTTLRMIAGLEEITELMGSTVHVHVTTPDGNFVLVIPANDLEGEGGTLAVGDSISFKLDAETIHVFNKQTGITLS